MGRVQRAEQNDKSVEKNGKHLENVNNEILALQGKDHERTSHHERTRGSDSATKYLPKFELVGQDIDPKKSVADHLKSGVFKEMTGASSSKQHSDKSMTDGPSGSAKGTAAKGNNEITVAFQNNDGKTNSDFRVTKGGEIQVNPSFANNPHRGMVIEVERGVNQLKPTAQQQANVDALVSYLDTRLKQEKPEVAKTPEVTKTGNISDQQELVSNNQTRKFDSTPQLQKEETVNRFNGGHGSVSRSESNAGRSLPSESNSLTGAGQTKTYESSRNRSDGSRYGEISGLINTWLNKSLGSPPDWSKVNSLIAKDELPKEFADAEYRKGFQEFVDKLKGQPGAITAQEMNKFLPRELQDKIATSSNGAVGNDANGPISNSAAALKAAALDTASAMGQVGKCAAGVQNALNKIGHGEWMGAGNAWDMGKKMASSGKFETLPIGQAQDGDIIVRSWNRDVIAQNGGRNYGDIVVVTGSDGQGNLKGANDHHGTILPDGGRYEGSYVLRLRA
ncbi:hypothetical protein BH10CYA1_BH10CYA1_48330 [soil metagenome]